MRHRSVVGHADNDRILRDAELLQFGHDLPNEWIDVALEAILQDAPRRRNLLGMGDEAC